MNKKKQSKGASAIFIIILILILIFGAFYFLTMKEGNQPAPKTQESTRDDKMTEDVGMTIENDSEIKEGDGEAEDAFFLEMEVPAEDETDSAPASNSNTGVYKDYSNIDFANANGEIILFFHAPWCPFCNTLNQDIVANAASIPSGVTIFKTDYDSETELKQEFDIRIQHSFVYFKDGELQGTWNGSSTLKELLSKMAELN